MRNTLLLLFVLLATFTSAQEESGRIIYEEKIILEFDMNRPGAERYREMMEKYKERTYEKELLFSTKATLYRDVPEEERSEADMRSGSGGRMRWMMFRPVEIIYTNVEAQNVVEQRDFMDKKFLIKDNPEQLDWKLGSEQKEILGQRCMKATAMMDTNVVEAWFSVQMPISAGPDGFAGLPGMIMELSMDKGNRVITASRIDEGYEIDELKEPKKGKKVSRDEFREIVKEKMMEMREQRGGGPGQGGGHRVIITR